MRAGAAVLCALLVCTVPDARALPPRAGADDVAVAPVTLVARRAMTGPAGCIRRRAAGHPVLHCRLERATLTDAVVTVRTAGRPTAAYLAHAELIGGIEGDFTRLDARLLGVLPVHATADAPLPAAAAPALVLTDVTLRADSVAVGGGRVRAAGLTIAR
ncbi:hypothetical protein [Streptomyces sp. NPDC049555]|uniref:hypothetical protein n=1 Tax=Streptomyces sp. NPDC049555 TaxID=3154930 RepID=UPI00344AE273